MSAFQVPAASLRLATAIRYWHAARIILAQQIREAEYMEPLGHLLSMTAELALKAYLLERGMPDKDISGRKIGHDLGSALRCCIERGLALSEEEVSLILIMRTAHLEHFHRYGPSTVDSSYAILLANETAALRSLARVIDLIAQDPRSLRHQHQHPADLDWPPTPAPTGIVTRERFDEMAAAAEAEARKVEKYGASHARKR